ncbi:MAG: hypothetical protein RLZ98_1190 [Pseudomonadota bacterium]|jgi:bifunctional UDP-N-acetylglucosamine pyrophosphorylase/glucosamine-1-phosphate N-acetyltransferase
MTDGNLMTVILAAGKGTRMKSARPKVLHEIAGLSMLGHVLRATKEAGASSTVVVVGPDMDNVAEEARRHVPEAGIAVQHRQQGTADAVLAARQAIASHRGPVLVLFADTPLLRSSTLTDMHTQLANGANVAVLGFEAADPTGYGRLLTDPDGGLRAIREHNDASEEERRVRLSNSGVMGFNCPDLLSILDGIGCDNAKGEYYLTDAVGLARASGLKATVTLCPEDEVLGVNSREQLASAESIYQRRRRAAAMQDGCTMIAPDTVWLSHDTRLGRDVVIEPNVYFGLGVTIEDGVWIRANCHFEHALIKTGAIVGPFARLRPGAVIGNEVHIGNFVEVKNVELGHGAKANHLAYLGDGTVGAGANIGAGTIFCNYDGYFKHRTEIGDKAFIGSNSSLVAPVKIGNGAYVGSGSVITREVPADALALERGTQTDRPGWAAKFRELMLRRKKT